METDAQIVDGCLLVKPVSLRLPIQPLEEFASCCGAGHLGEPLVPDSIWGLRVSAACYIHDFMFEWGEPEWASFHHSNAVFLQNLHTIIRDKTRNPILRWLRLVRATTYIFAVSTAGAALYWDLKKRQGEMRTLDIEEN